MNLPPCASGLPFGGGGSDTSALLGGCGAGRTRSDRTLNVRPTCSHMAQACFDCVKPWCAPSPSSEYHIERLCYPHSA